MTPWLVIGVSGVTCGGKSTLAHRLRDYFKQLRGDQLWNTPYIVGDVNLISQDDYFLPVDDVRHTWDEKLNAINFELLTSLDMKRMLTDITWIMRGRFLLNDPLDNIDLINEMSMSTGFQHYASPITQEIYHPNQYISNQSNFTKPTARHQCPIQNTNKAISHHLHQSQMHTNSNMAQSSSHNIMRINSQLVSQLRDNKINLLIIEGFTIFNQPELITLCNIKFHFHLPYERCYERRQKRTYDPPDVTGYFEICVWPHYEKNFNEIRERQDITFLNGELSKDRILKFVLQKIANYFDERCDVACQPPQKLLGIPSCYTNNSGVKSNDGGGVCSSGHLFRASLARNTTKTSPMDQ